MLLINFASCIFVLKAKSQQLQAIHLALSRMQPWMNYCGSPGGGHYALLVDSEVTLHPAQKSTVHCTNMQEHNGMRNMLVHCTVVQSNTINYITARWTVKLNLTHKALKTYYNIHY